VLQLPLTECDIGRYHKAMDGPALAPVDILAEFDVGSAVFVAQTQIATVWHVRCRDGQAAALKVYHKDDMAGERHGFDFVESLDGCGVAHVHRRNQRAALIEWLDGPSLGDLTRSGRDMAANMELVSVANRIHASRRPSDLKLPHLQDWFGEFFDLKVGVDCPARAAVHINRCKAMASRLLSGQHDVRPLHGDLHHDNIRLGPRGYCAIDAKGVLGERTYELANAFRNPTGADGTVRDPVRIHWLATYWAGAFAVDARRLIEWATAKCALSIAWRSGGTLHHDDELDLLGIFLHVLGDMPETGSFTPQSPSS
jgi:streptomycin 6-kinase